MRNFSENSPDLVAPPIPNCVAALGKILSEKWSLFLGIAVLGEWGCKRLPGWAMPKYTDHF